MNVFVHLLDEPKEILTEYPISTIFDSYGPTFSISLDPQQTSEADLNLSGCLSSMKVKQSCTSTVKAALYPVLLLS